ncbi:MAG: hypothetical protein V2A71_00355 [Candidatus Eisenbacteria bacterium]
MKRPFVIHPFLFALFPVLFLFSHNIEELSARVMIAPATVLILGAFLLWFLLSLLLRDRIRAGLVVSLALLLFFSYGHVNDLMKNLAWGGLGPLRHRHLLCIWGGLFALGAYFSLRSRRNLYGLTNFLNIVAIFSVAIPLFNIAVYEAGTRNASDQSGIMEIDVAKLPKAGELPDIYYIILDEYGGEDILREMYRHDNGPFLDSLSKRGFYVARKSRSNYHYTHWSLVSSLNSEYLTGTGNWRDRIRNSKVFRVLKKCGYTTVAFSSEISYTDLRNVDVYMGPKWAFNEFQNQLMNATPLLIVTSKLWSSAGFHRQHILYTLEHLTDASRSEKPVLVFAHIFCPHPPFVFEEDGSPATGDRFLKFDDAAWSARGKAIVEEYTEGYRKQIVFLNRRLTTIIDGMLSNSSRPCVIVLQADHGPRAKFYYDDIDRSYLKERFSILNAYYLPDTDYGHLYEGISPVNTFRVIFNRYLGTELELLDDRCYLTRVDRPGEFFDVTDQVADSSAMAGSHH